MIRSRVFTVCRPTKCVAYFAHAAGFAAIGTLLFTVSSLLYYVAVKPRLHDTTGCQSNCTTGGIHDTAVCKTGCQLNVCIRDTTGCETVLTTGYIV